ncbi:MAG: sulfotransferase [Gammaproteobacteria bacterium]|nr:sulfotransferase [Gammaproteobacteria bacterium]
MDTAAKHTADWHRTAEQRLARGDLDGAQEACREILRRAPDHADAHFLLGVATAGRGRVADGLRAIERAIELAPVGAGQAGVRGEPPPRLAEYQAQRARCLAMLKRDAEASAAADEALAAEPQDALTLDTLGVVLSRIGAHERAVPVFRRAVAAAPGAAAFQYNLASSLRFVGDFDAAEEAYEAALRCAPTMWRAHSALASLRRQTRDRNHIARLLALLDEAVEDVDGELHLRHALAKEYEDIGEYREAFRHLAAGKARKRAALGYSIDRDRALFHSVESVCDTTFVERACSAPADTGDRAAAVPTPIFVVGMPRTGTTLVERILSSHSGVTSAGELQAFGLCVKQAAGTRSTRVLDPETVQAAAGIDLAAVGQAYLLRARTVVGGAPVFVDKMPLNFFYAAFIRAALPQAKIVCLRRHPLDTCLSNFRQLFALGFSYYDYAFDLADIARYYVLFDRLMTHWERVLPGAVLSVSYEALVMAQERETRRLLEFCGLPWQDACLDFQANQAPVATASAVQVREPLHARAIGRWHRYEACLGPVRAELEAAGIRVDD